MQRRSWLRKRSGRALLLLVAMAAGVVVLTGIVGCGITSEQPSLAPAPVAAAPVAPVSDSQWHSVAALQPEILGIELERYLSGFITDIAEVQALGDVLRSVPAASGGNVLAELVAEQSPAGALHRACEMVQGLAEDRAREVISGGLRTAVGQLWGPQVQQEWTSRYRAHLARSFDAGVRALLQQVPTAQQPAAAWTLVRTFEPILQGLHDEALAQVDWQPLRQAVIAQVEGLWPSETWVDPELATSLQRDAADALQRWLAAALSEAGLLSTLRTRQRYGFGLPGADADAAWQRLQAGAVALRALREQLPAGPESVPEATLMTLAGVWQELEAATAALDRCCLNDRRFAVLCSDVRRTNPVALIRAAVMAREAGAEQLARDIWRDLLWQVEIMARRCAQPDLHQSEAFSLWSQADPPNASVPVPDTGDLQQQLRLELARIVQDVVNEVQPSAATSLLPDVQLLGERRLQVLQVLQRAVAHVDGHDVSHLVTLHGLQRWPEARVRAASCARLIRTLRARAMPRTVTPVAGDAAWQARTALPLSPPSPTVRIDQHQAARLVQLQSAETTPVIDGEPGTEPQDTPLAAIPYLVGSLNIDGHLGDWMPQAAGMQLLWPGTSTLPASTGPNVRVAWSSQGIWFSVRVPQPFRVVLPPASVPHAGTSLEWWFDLRGDRAPRLAQQPLAHQFIFLPFGDDKQELHLVEVGNDTRGLGRYDLLPDRQGSRGRIQTRRDDAGVVWIEGLVEMSALARSLLPGMRILAECSFNADGSVANSRQWAASKAADTWDRPELWGEWRLRGTAARLQALLPQDDSAVVVVAPDQVIDIVVADPDMDLDHDLIDVVAVGLGTQERTASVVLLVETAPGSGLFRQRVRVDADHFGAACQPGEFLALRYHDASTASGGSRLCQYWLAIGESDR